MTSEPFVSIITPNFNCQEHIAETIDSVLAQTCDDFEYIIIDGVSNDGSIEIIKSYLKNITKFICEKDEGMFDAVDKGIRSANGEVIIWINSDDILDKNAVKNVKKVFKLRPKTNWISCRNSFIKKDISFSTIPYLYPNFIIRFGYAQHRFWGFVQQESVAFRRKVYIDSGGLDKKSAAGDYHLWVKFSKIAKLENFFIKIGYFRSRKEQLSVKNREMYNYSIGNLKNRNYSFRLFRLIISAIFLPFIYFKTVFLLKKNK